MGIYDILSPLNTQTPLQAQLVIITASDDVLQSLSDLCNSAVGQIPNPTCKL